MSADQHQPSSDIEAAVHSSLPEHADGIYFDLAEDTYHADPALGSSDMRKLYEEPARYWFESCFNTLLEDDVQPPTPARVRGTAVHCFVLYGREAFEARYAPLHLSGTTKAGKVEREVIAASGKIGLKWSDYARIMQSGTILSCDPYLKVAFEGGRSEVSIFWTHEGIRKKARIDYLKLRATVDLKSVAPLKLGFAAACTDSLTRWNYPLQAAHYCNARAALRGLVCEGRVHGDHDTAWLREVAENEEWAWVWVFWQSVGSPLTGSLSLTPGSPILETAHRMLETAEANFRSFRDEFGMTTPWIRPQPTRELDITDMPAWWGR